MLLPARSISYDIGFSRVIVDSHIIILDHFQPSSLSQIEVRLSEYVLETLMVCIDLTAVPNKVVPPNLQCVYHCSQL
jgi:hypothetical protein